LLRSQCSTASAAAVADLLVAPVADVEGAVGADLLRDGDEVHVVRAQEVGAVFADVGAGVRVGVVRDEAMAVEVAEEELVAIRRREEAALINGEAAVRVAAAEALVSLFMTPAPVVLSKLTSGRGLPA
jgi:hypothetical protein